MSELNCTQPGCPVALTGRCLEGFSPASSCPYQSASERDQEESLIDASQDLVDLPSGEALTEIQAAEVAANDLTRVVILAGPYGSGKTTILTSLFEAFLDAPFASFQFRGSRTLVGFERRCHLGRKESGAEFADTTHTSIREGVVFLHLALASNDGGEFKHAHLLLSDISGELFQRLRDSGQAAKEMPSLRRADHVCLIIDGEKLTSVETRQVARNDSRSMLRSIIEAGVLSARAEVDVVITKWDAVVEAMEGHSDDEIGRFIEATKTALRDILPNRQIKFHEVAARPSKTARVPFAHGLPTLLRSWMGQEQSTSVPVRVFVPVSPAREFDRYLEAVIANAKLGNAYDVRRL